MKLDMHVHTSEASPCARVNAADMVRTYKEAGYDGIVLTNHIHGYSLNAYQGDYKRFLSDYLDAYRYAKSEGDKIGLIVLLGAEVCFAGNSGDFLLYGLTEEILSTLPCFPKTTLSEFNRVKGDGLLIYQAHPFRNGMQITDPRELFGIEIHNGNPRHASRNEFAKLWAEKHLLKGISGSDFHELEDVGRGGILLAENIMSEAELVRCLREEKYKNI